MTGWEYRIIVANTLVSLEPSLNTLGAEGWELVGVVAVAGTDGDSSHVEVVLKRPRALGSPRRS